MQHSLRSLLPTILLGFVVADNLDHQPQVPLSPANSCGPFPSYTALGDSYACGFGSLTRLALCDPSDLNSFGQTCTTIGCGQDIGGYAWRFAHDTARRVQRFQYLACNGNDTMSVLDSQVRDSKAFGAPDLVTVNMGGDDDSFFAKAVMACIVQHNTERCSQALQHSADIIAGLPSKYATVFAGIKEKVKPSTKVVAMGYAQFWGNLDATDCAWPLNLPTRQEKEKMNQLAKDMNAHLKDEALKAGYIYGDVDKEFEGRRICDQTGSNSFKSLFQIVPKFGADTGGKFYMELSVAHPTGEGQEVMLRVLEKALQC